MTATAGMDRALAKGGKTATGWWPSGTKAKDSPKKTKASLKKAKDSPKKANGSAKMFEELPAIVKQASQLAEKEVR